MRKRLPKIRFSTTRKTSVGSMEYYVTVNFYPKTANPGETFIKIAKEGSTIAGFVDALAISISIALQYGVPWDILRVKYMQTIFEPRDDEHSSIVDGIAKTITSIIKLRKEGLL